MNDWIRKGECNMCGDCCRHATNLVSLLIPLKDEAFGRTRFGEPHHQFRGPDGEKVFQVRGPVLLPCPKLDGDKCSIHETKPQYCIDNPAAPEDIEGTRCSYWFEHRETGELRGNLGVMVQEAQGGI